MWTWAAEWLNKAIAQSGNIQSLILARCYWQMAEHDKAFDEFQQALNNKEAPEYYIRLCMNAVKNRR